MTVPAHGTTRYLRTDLEVDDGVMRWHAPRTVLGIVRIGTRTIEVPVEDIRKIRMHRGLRLLPRLVAIALVLLAWVLLPWWLAAVFTIIGLWALLITLGPRIEVETRSGRIHSAPVCFGHGIDAELFIDGVNDIAGDARA